MNRFHLILLTFLLACGTRLQAQQGASAFEYLNFTHSAHIHALGGGNISIVENDLSLVGNNPALLGAEMGGQLGLNYQNFVSDINALGAEYAYATSEQSALLGGINYMDYGKFVHTDEVGNVIGSVGAKDMILHLAYAHDLSAHWRGGVSAKYIYSLLHHTSLHAIAVDAGVNYYDSDKGLSLSALLKNMGGAIAWSGEELAQMPFDIQLGVSKQFAHAPIRLSFTAQHLTQWGDAWGVATTTQEGEQEGYTTAQDIFRHLIIGCDFLLHPNFYAAIGYNYKTRLDMTTYRRNLLSGFSLGAGVHAGAFALSASYTQHHVSGNTFMFNLVTSLNQLF